MTFWIDQAASKKECIDLLEGLGENCSDEEADTCLKKVNQKSKDWYINHEMLMALLRSQTMCGNIEGAAKVISLRVPNQRLKFMPFLGGLFGY